MSYKKSVDPLHSRHLMRDCPIAITGVATLMPGSLTFRDFWRHVWSKKDFITDVRGAYWKKDDYFDPDIKAVDKTYCYRGGFLDPVDFPAVDFGIPPKMLSDIDTTQLLSLIVAKHALEQACAKKEIPLSEISVILGATGGTKLFCESSGRLEYPKIINAMRKAGIAEDKIKEVVDLYAKQFASWTENTFPGLLINVITGRITNRLNLGGENCAVDAACASGLAAISYAIDKLTLGNTKMVLSGGVDTSNAIPMFMCFSKTPALSPTMDIRPFSKDADGTLLGEGIGIVALKKLTDAEADGDTIYGVIRGIGRSSDGRAKSIYAPSPDGQQLALHRCYEDAGYSPETVELVEGHGTGTKAGDKSELETMCAVFTTGTRKNYCGVGSVKSQYGHTKGAAGAIGLAKVVGALVNRVKLPTMKAENPIETENTALFVNTECRPWFKSDQNPRRAGVSAFGFGGTNYHITVEEYTGKNRLKKTIPFTLIPISGDVTAEQEKIRARCAEGYVLSETYDHLMSEYIETFDSANPAKLVLVSNIDNPELEVIKTPINPVFVLPEKFKVFAGVQIACAFDAARMFWERLPQDVREAVYPNQIPSGTLDESFNIHFEALIGAMFKHFGITIEFAANGIKVPDTLPLSWFVETLAQLSLSAQGVNFKILLDEFDLTYPVVQKPKFSVPVAGYNYGKPTLD